MDQDLVNLKRAVETAGSAIVGVSRDALLRLIAAVESREPQIKDEADADVS